MNPIRFTIEGPPVTWKRAKRGDGRSYTDPAAALHMERIRAAARNAGCRDPSAGPFRLRFIVYTAWEPIALQSGDLDNHEKIVKDSLNGVAWKDDRQVVHVEKWKAQDVTWQRTEVEIGEMVGYCAGLADAVPKRRLAVEEIERRITDPRIGKVKPTPSLRRFAK